jgi:nitrogen fixation protein FixH
MKINWGVRIVVLYVGFVALIVTLVILSSSVNNELESKDYYAKELAFQDKINATQNENKLNHSINYEIIGRDFILDFNVSDLNPTLSGTVFFYRPSETALDKEYPIKFDKSGKQIINLSQFKNGVYIVQINWVNNSIKYYKEVTINLK